MRLLVYALAVVTIVAAFFGAHAALPRKASAGAPVHHKGFALALDRVAQTISGRHDVDVRCGRTSGSTILGTVIFYGSTPGREALLAPQVCGTLERLWKGKRPSLACTRLGGGACGADVVALAWATSALAHESFHLRGVRNEAAAECYGLQSAAFTAQALGAPAEYAQQLATYTFWNVRPPVDYGYFSPECKDGGKLDLRPQTHRWP